MGLMELCETQPTRKDKMIRILQQFTPHSYMEYRWRSLKSPKRFVVYCIVLAFELLIELNLF